MPPDVIIPCETCGAELYDRIRKYHMVDDCTDNPCYNFVGGHYSKGSYCPECNTNQIKGVDPAVLEEERKILFMGA